MKTSTNLSQTGHNTQFSGQTQGSTGQLLVARCLELGWGLQREPSAIVHILTSLALSILLSLVVYHVDLLSLVVYHVEMPHIIFKTILVPSF